MLKVFNHKLCKHKRPSEYITTFIARDCSRCGVEYQTLSAQTPYICVWCQPTHPEDIEAVCKGCGLVYFHSNQMQTPYCRPCQFNNKAAALAENYRAKMAKVRKKR